MKLTEKQNQAINHYTGPCLVLAVPGAGKTTMILERIKILSKDVNPSNILSLTFSRTQALDMKERYKGPKSNFMTIHAFCYLIIRNYYKKTGQKLQILESDDKYNKYNLISKIYYDINGKLMSSEDLKNFFTTVGYMRNSMDDISYLKNSDIKNIEKIYLTYESFKRENAFIDFDDMQSIALDILNNNPRMLKSVKNKYKFIQLDEGQDSSILQFKILEKIVYPENNLMVVADDDQSIYSFRAADPSYILDFKNVYPKAKVITMNQNHRSQANIVNTSAQFISLNKNRFEKNLYTNKKAKAAIRLKECKNTYDCYEYIKKNLNTEKTTAILYRNNISSLNLVSFLMEDNIDFSINNGSIDFFDSKIIRDLENIISFSEDFSNASLFKEIYYMVGTYLTKEEVANLEIKPMNFNVFDWLHENIDDKKAYNLLRKERQFKDLRKKTLDKKIQYIYNTMGYRDYIQAFSSKYYELVLNKELYIESMINFTKNLNNLEEFKDKKEAFSKLLNKRFPSNLILSTIHKSKGLEYDDVFVIDLVKGEFPMILDYKNKDKSLEEERRMFYVAMTRAKENLHLISLKSRNNHKVSPSEFFLDIKNIEKGYKGK